MFYFIKVTTFFTEVYLHIFMEMEKCDLPVRKTQRLDFKAAWEGAGWP